MLSYKILGSIKELTNLLPTQSIIIQYEFMNKLDLLKSIIIISYKIAYFKLISNSIISVSNLFLHSYPLSLVNNLSNFLSNM